MAIDNNVATFLALCARLGVDFTKTLTLGRQSVNASAEELVASHASQGLNLSAQDARHMCDADFADDYFAGLGAVNIESVDASDFEGSSIVHDLNEPFPEGTTGGFTAVIDGGTLEHVFNAPQALLESSSLVKPGGHWISYNPTDGMNGHGFFQFSPEFFFRGLASTGFSEPLVLIKSIWQRKALRPTKWLRVTDPAVLGERVSASSQGPAMMFVLARRHTEACLKWPQQSDYVAHWGQSPLGTDHLPHDPAPVARRLLEHFGLIQPLPVGLNAVELAELKL